MNARVKITCFSANTKPRQHCEIVKVEGWHFWESEQDIFKSGHNFYNCHTNCHVNFVQSHVLYTSVREESTEAQYQLLANIDVVEWKETALVQDLLL